MRARRALDGSFYVMGGRIPVAIGILMGLTLGASILGVLGLRAGLPLLATGILVPERVWEWELWRLVTWVFFEVDPLGLIFSLLALWWFGRDLCYAWGPARFLRVYLGLAAGAAGVTCLIARFLWPGLLPTQHLGSWALVGAILIAWSQAFPSRQILAYLVLPMGGRNLVYFTVGTTLLFAVFHGPAAFVPHFTAYLLMFAYLGQFRRLWLRLRLARMQRAARRPTHLRAVDRYDGDEPPRWLH